MWCPAKGSKSLSVQSFFLSLTFLNLTLRWRSDSFSCQSADPTGFKPRNGLQPPVSCRATSPGFGPRMIESFVPAPAIPGLEDMPPSRKRRALPYPGQADRRNFARQAAGVLPRTDRIIARQRPVLLAANDWSQRLGAKRAEHCFACYICCPVSTAVCFL